MEYRSIRKSAILTLLSVVGLLLIWEYMARSRQFIRDYDDDAELWANQRQRVYAPSSTTSVFIGSSRIKYDLDIPTYEKQTGLKAIQLSMVGSSPIAFLDDLAGDPTFKGKLMVDVTEFLFFNPDPWVSEKPLEAVEYYRKRTPAQMAGFILGSKLESTFAFLNKNYLSLNALLSTIHMKNRPGVRPDLTFPQGFQSNTYPRQSKMQPAFLLDTAKQNRVKAVWLNSGRAAGTAPLRGPLLEQRIQAVRLAVQKIKSRGGDVLFLRTPSSGVLYAREIKAYPRRLAWDRLLAETGCIGINFMDYPLLNQFTCVELSHLSPADAVRYTAGLISILKKERGWLP